MKSLDIGKRLTSKKDKDFFEKALLTLENKTINFVNLDDAPEDACMFETLVKNISSLSSCFNVKVSPNVDTDDINIVFLHNEDYY